MAFRAFGTSSFSGTTWMGLSIRSMEMEYFRRGVCIAFLTLPFALVAAQSAGQPFSRLPAAESAAILRGESIFRQPSGWRELALPAGAPFAQELTEETRKSGANYIGEVLMVLPWNATTAGLPGSLALLLGEVEKHVGIPYYSVRNKETYPLYDKAVILERSTDATKGKLIALLHMEPFSDYRASYVWTVRSDGLSFRSENLSPLEYRKTKAVATGDLVWRLEAYVSGEQWILYGIGRVKAFDMFGLLRDRLSASFTGRIEAFYSSIFARLK